eukprot:CAMPEP_0116083446 /NCGR_PEP_ID=MMETSP0327-20121206/3277_1 /TAXON_ID=44447 /ORGANISM="Pseudo-nitzschia delicatissima, Strain B596" /LENGTH=244 /DNA_ID=CAMNT_0003574333 /DNA_START=253 /DNA_END=984 /DNA_ORIENTATION=-
MFSVARFDPRKADAPRKRSGSVEKKKKSKLRSSDKDAKKKKKKRKRDSKSHDGDENLKQQKDVEESSPAQMMTDTYATENIAVEKTIDENQVSTTSVREEDQAMPVPEPEAAFRVIAPETDGALSSKKNLRGKITAEAFDDLDLTDDAWLASSSKKKKIPRKVKDGDGDENDESKLAFDPTDEIERALEMTRLPILEAARRWGMADFLVRNLRANGHEHFFPIQALVIPDVIMGERHMTSLRVR